MTVRVDDPRLTRTLLTAGQAVELEGPNGEPLGTFTPAAERPLPPSVSEEELLRRLNDPAPGFTTEQVLAHLRGL
jgi:hypothetical protein